MINVQKFLQDLARYKCIDQPPDDKKHMKYSSLTPESIMILKRLNFYCDQKEYQIEEFLVGYSYK